MQEGVIVLDAYGSIVLFNPAIKKLLNLKPEDLGKPPIEVIRNADLQAIVDRSLKGENIQQQEIRIFQEGEEKIFMAQATPFLEKYSNLGAIIVM